MASIPTAIFPGCSRAASRTKDGSRTAAVPMTTRATPFSSQASEGAHVADAAAELNGNVDRGEDPVHRRAVHRLAGKGAVEIDAMQPFENPWREKVAA